MKGKADYGQGKVKLSVPQTDIPTLTVVPTSTKNLYHHAQMYCVWIQRKYGFETTYAQQQMYNAYRQSQPYVPKNNERGGQLEVPFETNMMEALEGWKSWNVTEGLLETRQCKWPIDQPLEAKCETYNHIVNPNCSCGIYAADEPANARAYWQVFGRVYGWGRYVRGDKGWRVQYAYPKAFYLRAEQIDLVDTLRKYHVPIFVEQPLLVYNPEEDGYEYRNTEENGDSGTVEGSDTDEERGHDEEN